ncbi:MAG: hypothetical protein COA42_11085 [Alteromonadaceae bacterium]|nr:MAG: hypothetical protein COA42_11085 [Alteromonadaceae bacterium]
MYDHTPDAAQVLQHRLSHRKYRLTTTLRLSLVSKLFSLALPNLALLLLCLTPPLAAAEQTNVTHIAPSIEGGRGEDYEIELLKLALDKTQDDYGTFTMKVAPDANSVRGLRLISQNKIPDYVRSYGYKSSINKTQTLDYVRFPISLGILSYRVCFVSEAMKSKVAQAESLEALKVFTHGQGLGWSDVLVMRNNGFKVFSVSYFKGLYKMTALNRVNLFCRGANEIYSEYQQYQSMQGLALEETFALYYPHPRFFFTHKSNIHIIARLTTGLHRAFNDGSLEELWRKYNQASLDFAKLDQRKIYRLETPEVEGIDFDYELYFYHFSPKSSLPKP